MILEENLAKKGIIAIRKGDDIYIDSNDLKKLTVSIATVSASSMKIHLGINVTFVGTPDDVDTIGLFELDIDNSNNSNIDDNYNNYNNNYFNENNLLDFINDIVNSYINELNDIELDISKTNLL